MLRLLAIVSLFASTTAHALPPGAAARGFVEGANHHIGDAGFIAAFGRPPGAHDSEADRMHTHFVYVRAFLMAQPATRPELEARRLELLGYLDEYTRAGTTPKNLHVAWRTPVFIDDDGQICAVGYLMERSVGRALAERVAATHRYDYLEDITLPEVQAWIAGSGFTLTELASIQPGYEGPLVDNWGSVSLGPARDVDAWECSLGHGTVNGSVHAKQMSGNWKLENDDGRLVGQGTFTGGNGTWQSFYPSGRVMARGPFRDNHPEGAWTLYFPSGRVAAEGAFTNGTRSGTWRFYDDRDGQPLITTGRFNRSGWAIGTWQAFGASGNAIVRSAADADRLEVAPGVVVEHDEIYETHDDIQSEVSDLTRIMTPDVTLMRYQSDDGELLIDGDGRRLERVDGQWRVGGCSVARGASFTHRSLRAVHRRLRRELQCDEPVDALGARDSAVIDRALAAYGARREPMPRFAQVYYGNIDSVSRSETDTFEPGPCTVNETFEVFGSRCVDGLVVPDLATSSEANQGAWPHVDQRFNELFATLPDRTAPTTGYDGDCADPS